MSVGFRIDPLEFVSGTEASTAVTSLEKYFVFPGYTGRHFETLVAQSESYRFTATDLVAVGMLSVTVPPEASFHLLSDPDGEMAGRLRQIPDDTPIWSDDAERLHQGPGLSLWQLVKSQPDVGRTIASKLLAAKRPDLFPVFDRFVGEALLASPRDDYWACWRESFAGTSGAALRARCDEVKMRSGLSPAMSPLRVLDVVIWMRVHGDPTLKGHDRFWER